jgi:hypothetical protein
MTPLEPMEMLLTLLFVLELIFIFLVVKGSKPKEDSWLSHTLMLKICSLAILILGACFIWISILALLLIVFIIDMIFNFIFNVFDFTLLLETLCITIIIAVWIGVNYLIAVNLGEERKDDKRKRRRKRKKK